MESLLNLDYWLFEWINNGWSNPVFDLILVNWRNSFFWAPFYVFIIAFYFFNFGKKGYWIFIFSLMTIATSDLASSRIIKPLIERPRPCHSAATVECTLRVRCGSGYSFTSSHATNHFAIASFIFFTLGLFYKKLRWLLFLWAAIVGLAQIYVGVHYPSDVLVGSFLGLFIGYVWSTLYLTFYGNKLFLNYLRSEN